VELFAKDRGMQVAGQPRTRGRTKTQLFHAFHNATHGTLFLNEVDDGGPECFAGRLSPQGWKVCRSFHDDCPKNETSLSLAKENEESTK
jgi:hypothetical protein